MSRAFLGEVHVRRGVLAEVGEEKSLAVSTRGASGPAPVLCVHHFLHIRQSVADERHDLRELPARYLFVVEDVWQALLERSDFLACSARCVYLPLVVRAPDGEDSSPKLVGVMFSEIGQADIFYGDSGAFHVRTTTAFEVHGSSPTTC